MLCSCSAQTWWCVGEAAALAAHSREAPELPYVFLPMLVLLTFAPWPLPALTAQRLPCLPRPVLGVRPGSHIAELLAVLLQKRPAGLRFHCSPCLELAQKLLSLESRSVLQAPLLAVILLGRI